MTILFYRTMAAPPSSLFSPYVSITKRRIDCCLVDIVEPHNAHEAHDEGVHQLPPYPSDLPLPVSLHISYNKDSVLSLRLRVSVALQNNPETAVIFLDIPTDKIVSLSLSRRPQLPERLASKVQPSQAGMRLSLADSAGVLIAPLATQTLDPETWSDAQVLGTLRILSQSHALVIYLPPGNDLWEHLSTDQMSATTEVPTSSEPLLRVAGSPARLDLKTLYRGKGGRVVPPGEAFGHPLGRDTSGANGADSNTSPQSPVELPPSYNETVPPSVPDAPFSARKRPRTSPGNDDVLQTQRGEGSGGKEGNLDASHEILYQARAMLEKLQASTATAATMDARLRATMQEVGRTQPHETEVPPSPGGAPRATSASLSPTASRTDTASRTSSVSEAISERLKAYLDERLLQLRQDMQEYHESRLDESLEDYATIEYMEQYVGTEIGETTVDFIEESQMWEAIREAVDGVEDDIRTRMIDAWTG